MVSFSDTGDRGSLDSVSAQANVRAEIYVWGTVQGVGFRPFVYGLATRQQLAGSVRNEGAYVRIVLMGLRYHVEEFLQCLVTERPAASDIRGYEVLSVETIRNELSGSFQILPSLTTATRAAMSIPPDMAVCEDCLEELLDPHSRYYRYPFISCTQCGPRYTLARSLPFDREATTMTAFPLCTDCEHDYTSPASRRFHAQAAACSVCGPKLAWYVPGQEVNGYDTACPGDDANALRQAQDMLMAGGIVAIMGVGGFHLAVNALDSEAVNRLRVRKQRPAKPLAVMMNREKVSAFCEVSPEEWEQLSSRQAPIVLLKSKTDAGLPEAVAPGMVRLGVFLPYTAMHVLLLEDPRIECLVMTSGNISGEPLAFTIEDALNRLSGIADGFLFHNREILRPVDDSVLRVDGPDVTLMRRSRGFVPNSFSTAKGNCAMVKTTALAVGGDVKNAFALLKDGDIWLGPHIGDLERPRTYQLFQREIDWYKELLQAEPQMVIRDLHANYYSSQYAEALPVTKMTVQHHHAHMAACLFDNNVYEPVVGVILDGFGLGDDGQIWGGEILYGDCRSYERVGHLTPVRWIGGDAATKEPWRGVINLLYESGISMDDVQWAAQRLDVKQSVLKQYTGVLRSSYPGLLSTSTGRLFDAVAALVLCQGTVSYEGELPMRLESLVDDSVSMIYEFPIEPHGDKWLLSFDEALSGVVKDLQSGTSQSVIATAFHRGLAIGLAHMTCTVARKMNVKQVALGGGVWQNPWLFRWYLSEVSKCGIEVLMPRRIPVNDGGLAVGQLAVMMARLAQN